MHTGLAKLPLLPATRLSPLGSWPCTELMTQRGWTPNLHSDTSLTAGHCRTEPSVPTICSLDSILRADFFFPSSRQCCEACCVADSQPWQVAWPSLPLGSQLHSIWKTLLMAVGGPGVHDGRITRTFHGLALRGWVCDSSGQSPGTTNAHEWQRGLCITISCASAQSCPPSLVVRRLTILLPMQGTRVQSLVQKIPRATGQLNPCTTTTEAHAP